MFLEMLLVDFIGLYSQRIAKLEVELEYITLSMMILWSKYDYMGFSVKPFCYLLFNS